MNEEVWKNQLNIPGYPFKPRSPLIPGKPAPPSRPGIPVSPLVPGTPEKNIVSIVRRISH